MKIIEIRNTEMRSKEMKLKPLSGISVAIVIGLFTSVSFAEHDQAGHRWVPNHPDNTYWQAPAWPTPGQIPANRPAPPSQAKPTSNQQSGYTQNYSAPQPPPAGNNRPPQSMNQPGGYRPAPPAYPQRGYPPPRGPYYGPDSGASAFYTPGYNPYRHTHRNNKFWGRSGPSKWMKPNKDNLEQGWDDMINAPSRMGTMPGGWNAPEVTMPNPVDMGDQMQDNMRDLPQQIRDMNVGNEVND